jgi:hypothetical protein
MMTVVPIGFGPEGRTRVKWLVVLASLCSLASFCRADDGSGLSRITGRVVFEGNVPSKLTESESVLSDDNQGVRWVVALFLPDDGRRSSTQLPAPTAVLTLKPGSLSPFVTVGRVGGSIEVVNNDVETVIIKLAGIDLIEADFIEPKGRLKATIQRPEISPAVCVEEVDGAHRRAWVVAPDSPYAAVTDQNGEFVIESVPPSPGSVRFWHPRIKFSRVLKNSRVRIGVQGKSTFSVPPIEVSAKDVE